jgi:hypothetical protein
VLHRVKEERTRRKASWVGLILRRNCLIKHVIEGNITRGIEVTGRRRRSKLVLDNIKETRGSWKLKE